MVNLPQEESDPIHRWKKHPQQKSRSRREGLPEYQKAVDEEISALVKYFRTELKGCEDVEHYDKNVQELQESLKEAGWKGR